jgi:surface polysaccharide O-acyltransferase-like enzyme
MFRWGKFIALIFCVITVIPMFLMIFGALVSDNRFENTVLGNITNINE